MAQPLQPIPDHPVRRDATRHGESRIPWRQAQIFCDRASALLLENIGNRCLEPGTKIGPILRAKRVCPFHAGITGPQEGGFETGERHVASRAIQERSWKPKSPGVSRLGNPFHLRPAGLRQCQEAGGLVEGFAGGIVDGATKPMKAVGAMDNEKLAMSAGGEQDKVGKRDRIGHARGKRMTSQMIDADDGSARRGREALGAHHPGQHTADKTRPGGHRDRVQISKCGIGAVHGRFDDPVELLCMGSSGNLWDNATIGCVQLDLPRHDIRKDFGTCRWRPTHHGGRGVIATALDTEQGERVLGGERLQASGSGGYERDVQIELSARKVNLKSVSLLLTRPEASSRRFCRQVEEKVGTFKSVLVSPLLQIEWIPIAQPPKGSDIVVFTSENGVRALGTAEGLNERRAWCVGSRTVSAAEALGFRVAGSAATVDALVEMLENASFEAPLVHIAGRHRRGDLCRRLRAAGKDARTITAYEQRPLPLSGAARSLLQMEQDVVAPVFSPRSTLLLAGAAETRQARVHLVAISLAATTGWTRREGEEVQIATSPDAKGVLRAMGSLFDADPSA